MTSAERLQAALSEFGPGAEVREAGGFTYVSVASWGGEAVFAFIDEGETFHHFFAMVEEDQ